MSRPPKTSELVGVPAVFDLELDPAGTDVGKYVILVSAARDLVPTSLACPFCHGALDQSPTGALISRVVKLLRREGTLQHILIQAAPEGTVGLKCRDCAAIFARPTG